MSIPRKHHYLPEFFIDRWAVDGKVWRFERLLTAPGQRLHGREVTAAAAANEKDLYADPTVADPRAKQMIEIEFFGKIDDQGARAIALLDKPVPLPVRERKALSQFVVSLLHRSPSRIDWILKKLEEDFLRTNGQVLTEAKLRSGALLTLTTVVGSGPVVQAVSEFGVYNIELTRSRFGLLLSDRPVALSNGIAGPRAFLMLPISPRNLLILTPNKAVALAFSTQDHSKLARAVNDAIVSQAQHVVISNTAAHKAFVDARLLKGALRHNAASPFDGLVRWKVP